MIKKKNNLFLFLTLIVLSAITSKIISSFLLPSEDAAILFRYVENFSNSGIISYNFNSEKIEGATDFLWMVILSIFHYFNFDTYFAAIFINLVSLGIIINILRSYYNLNSLQILILLILKISLVQFISALLGFSVLFIELLLISSLICYFKKKYFLCIFFSFLGCLTRPDFILFIFPLHVLILFFEKFNKKLLFYSFFTFLGLSYFFLRFKYFELLLPTSFYIKNSWSIFQNQEWGRELIIFSPLIFIFALLKPKELFSKNILILVFTLIFATIYYTNQNLIQNVGYRFYFYFSTILILIVFELQKNNLIKTKFLNYFFLIFILNSILLNLSHNYSSIFYITKNHSTYKLSRDLNRININNDLKMAVTEPGIIPYYSKIYTIDLFGLNTKKFTFIPADGNFLKKNKFDILIFNTDAVGDTCESFFNAVKKINPSPNSRNISWKNFNLNLLSGVNLKTYDVFISDYPKMLMLNNQGKKYEELLEVFKKNKINKCQ